MFSFIITFIKNYRKNKNHQVLIFNYIYFFIIGRKIETRGAAAINIG